jgi:hypothetical protein
MVCTRAEARSSIFVELAERDSFTLREPRVEGIGPAKSTCNGDAQCSACTARSDCDDLIGRAHERIENGLDVCSATPWRASAPATSTTKKAGTTTRSTSPSSVAPS